MEHAGENTGLELTPAVAEALAPLFAVLSLEQAMRRLVVEGGPVAEHTGLVEEALRHPAFAGAPDLAAGLWLYVDDLDRSHAISQGLPDATGSFWHGIMHRREGDFGNSHYWFDRAGAHPAMALVGGYDGHGFIDRVAAHRGGGDAADLVALQQREWWALFCWCAARHSNA